MSRPPPFRFLVLAAGLAVWFAASPAHAQRRVRVVRPVAGTLALEGGHPGAQVYVDAVPVGVLPLEPRELDLGPHTLRVSMPGYTEFTEVVSIGAGERTVVTVQLLAVSMALSIRSTPSGARVFVDDRFAGTTPVQVDLFEGPHVLRVSKQGFEDAHRSVTGTAGTREELAVDLVPLSEEALATLRPKPAWYARPMTWVVVGAAALAVAAGVVAVVALTAEPTNAVDSFCSGGDCVRVSPEF